MKAEAPTIVSAVPFLDLKAQYAAIREEVRAAVDRVMDSQVFILGPEVEALEREAATYSHSPYGIAVSSGTDALLVALMAIGIQPGDEVIAPTYTFFATAGSIARLGARPVFVDIDLATYNLNPQAVEAAITPRTRALIPVHLFGQMADMDAIMAVARRHDLIVIEDAAQAIGSEYKGQRAGSLGQLACFSFFPSKNLGGFGDGGLVTANDDGLAKRVRLLRGHGAHPKYYHQLVGGNFRLDALQAAVLRVKLKYLDNWTEARQRNAAFYREQFTELDLRLSVDADLEKELGLVLPVELNDVRHIYNQFVIRTGRREALIAYLRQRGIGSEIYYPVPMHLQECFADLGYRAGDFPKSEQAARESLAIPIYPELTEAMQSTVVEAIAEFCQREAA